MSPRTVTKRVYQQNRVQVAAEVVVPDLEVMAGEYCPFGRGCTGTREVFIHKAVQPGAAQRRFKVCLSCRAAVARGEHHGYSVTPSYLTVVEPTPEGLAAAARYRAGVTPTVLPMDAGDAWWMERAA